MRKKFILSLFVILSVIMILSLTSSCTQKESVSGGISVNYFVRVALDDSCQSLYVTQETNIRNVSAVDITSLPFYVYPNAYAENGGSFIVGTVKQADKSLNYDIHDVNMTVSLDAPLCSGEETAILFTGTVKMPNGAKRLGITDDGSYNLHGFFSRLAYYEDGFKVVPYCEVGDPFYFGMDDFVVTIEYPKSYVVAGSGERIEEVTVGESIKTTFAIDGARDVAFVLDKNLKLFETESKGVKILHYTEGEENLEKIVNCFNYLVDNVGEYPYKTLSVVETQFDYGGMEYSSLVRIGEDNTLSKDYVMYHEIIHQWFGLNVGSNSYDECWVDESLTNFLSYYYMDKLEVGALKQNLDAEKIYYKNYILDAQREYGESYLPRMNVDLNTFKSQQENSIMVYGYGALMYGNIFDTVGESKFLKGVRCYYEEYAGLNATGEKLIESFKKSCGRGVEAIFCGYLNNEARI